MKTSGAVVKTKRKRRLGVAFASLCIAVVGTVLGLQSCSMPTTKATPEQIASLSRGSVVVPETSLTLSYLHSGDANLPRVIFIHGTPGSADGWADFLVKPRHGFESIAIDRLGFGKSSGRDGGVVSFEEQATAIAPLLVQRQGKWPILVGHSLGGPIAARLAAIHPARVAGLVIVAGSLDPELEKPGLAQTVATTGLVRFFLPQTLDNSMGELDAAKKQTTLLAPELAKITCPVIIVHGTMDELVPYANAAYSKKMLTSARSCTIVTLDKQGHFVPWERPETIRQAVHDLAKPF